MPIIDSKDTDPIDSDPDADVETTAGPTPEVQDVYIMIVNVHGKHDLRLFFDAAGTIPMDNTTPLFVLGNPTGNRVGRVRFNFIGDPTGELHGRTPDGKVIIETADLIIIGQTVADSGRPHGHRKGSPFFPPDRPAYFIDDPAADSDPGNVNGTLPGRNGVITTAIPLKVRTDDPDQQPYKYSIIALCDGRTIVAPVDPIVIIKPN